MPRRWLVLLALVVALTSCTGPDEPLPDDPSTVAPRTNWALDHRVVKSGDIRVTGHAVGPYAEGTDVSVGQVGGCGVTLHAPGQGGPEEQAGEKVPATVSGYPALRSGSGSDASFLMWQHDGIRWTAVSCPTEDLVDVVADAVEYRTTPVTLPFGLSALPGGYSASSLLSDDTQGTHAVYLSRVAGSSVGSDLVVSLETGVLRVDPPPGRPTTVAGRPAVLDGDRETPGLCVREQQRYVCVCVNNAGDSGPHPDRSGDIPALTTIAEHLRFAADLDDRSSWLDASEALPQ